MTLGKSLRTNLVYHLKGIKMANHKIESTKIRLGQFLTSKQIADFMVKLATKKKDLSVLEPSAGKGVFVQSLLDSGFKHITAIEYDSDFFNQLKETFNQKEIILKRNDFLKETLEKRYDLIIGNPPYVQWNHIEPEIRDYLKNDSFWKQYSNGEWDLLYAFIIWSIEKLNQNGELIFIVPYNWFNSTHGKSLRNYLINHGRFDIILHFGELKLFGDCFPNNIIFRYTKTQDRSSKIKVCEFPEKKADLQILLEKIDEYLFNGLFKENGLKCFEMPNFDSPNNWFLGNPEDFAFVEKLEKTTAQSNLQNIYTHLSEYFNISVGMVTGFDKAFFVSNKNEFNEPEQKYIKSFVKAKNCKRYCIQGDEKYLFLDSIQNENELKKLPNIYRQLLSHKQELDNRYMSKEKKWWHWATVRNYSAFLGNLTNKKIFVPCIDRSKKQRFSLTCKEVYGGGDVIMISKKPETKEDLLYVLAWLNSEYVQKWYSIKGNKKGHRTQYTQVYVSKIPFKIINWTDKEQTRLYSEIIKKTELLLKNKNDGLLENEINVLFQNLLKIY